MVLPSVCSHQPNSTDMQHDLEIGFYWMLILFSYFLRKQFQGGLRQMGTRRTAFLFLQGEIKRKYFFF